MPSLRITLLVLAMAAGIYAMAQAPSTPDTSAYARPSRVQIMILAMNSDTPPGLRKALHDQMEQELTTSMRQYTKK